MKPVLDVRDITFSYQTGPPVLSGVSFQIQRGEFVAITGPSGSGKSTLFYLLGLLTSRFKGDVEFEGHSYRKLNSEQAAVFRNHNIGFVFQQFYLFPRASVLDNVLLPTYFPYETSAPNAADRRRAEKLLNELGIGTLVGRKPQELSGGQQQRVAIARALMRDPDLILADEPTGNLDSASSEAVFNLLKELNRKGKTIVLITHSPELANQCQRVIRFRDGKIQEDISVAPIASQARSSGAAVMDAGSVPPVEAAEPEMTSAADEDGLGSLANKVEKPRRPSWIKQWWGSWTFTSYLRAVPLAWQNLLRSKAKSFLTMLGVVLGIAAVLSTLSLGDFTKRRVLAGYESMGVNNLTLNGYANWRRTSRDYAPAVFQSFDADKDLVPMQKVFREIVALSPVLSMWSVKFNAEGQSTSDGVAMQGVNEDFFKINTQALQEGRTIKWIDVENAHPICVIGAGIKKTLFRGRSPVNKQLTLASDNQEQEFPCRIVGVYIAQPTQSTEVQPDNTVYAPYTYLQRNMTNPWERSIRNVRIKIASGMNPDEAGKQIEGYFKSRYGTTGTFSSNSNAKVIEEMRMFVTIFSSLLTAVALIALVVGGVGINNMMLVNLSERLKELGLRKALGATPQQIRALLLTEAVVLCTIGGFLGLLLGFLGYHGLIFAATKLIPDLKFEWVVLWFAVALSAGAVFLTGILSGLTPALKAERLQVIDALRQD